MTAVVPGAAVEVDRSGPWNRVCKDCRCSGHHHADLGRKRRHRMTKMRLAAALLKLEEVVVMAEGAEEVLAPLKLGPVAEVAAAAMVVVVGAHPK